MFSGVMMLILLTSCGAKNDIASFQDTSINSLETSAPIEVWVDAQIDEPIVLSQGFIEYDESYIGESENTVLFFHQESCPTCKATEASLIESGVWPDMTVLKVDFDASENNDLRQKYGVTMKHTFVQVDVNGNMIKKWNWSLDLSDIEEQVYGESFPESVMMKDEDTNIQVEEDIMIQEEWVMMKEDTIQGEVMETKELAWVYANYDSSLVGARGDTVLFFHASWCPSCSAADKGISAGVIPENLSILKVDYDSSTDLRKKYGVVAQHTFVQVDADGNEIKKWVGGTSVEDIAQRIN